MPCMIETFDKAGSLDIRRANRVKHFVYLDQIKDQLLACGAKLNDDGSDAGGGLYVDNVNSRPEAEALIRRTRSARWASLSASRSGAGARPTSTAEAIFER